LAGYTGVLPIFRGQLMAYLGIDDAGFGQLFSLGPMAGVISVLFGGVLLDRWGPRRLIHLGLLGVGSAMLLIAVGGRQLWVFALAVIVAGLCAGPLFIAITAYLARLFPTHQRRVISLNLASSSLGGLLLPLIAEGLLALPRRTALTFAQVVHLPFLLVGGLLLAGSLLYRPTAGSARTSARCARPARWPWRDLALPPSALALAALIALHGMADSILYFWMPRFLESASFVTPCSRRGWSSLDTPSAICCHAVCWRFSPNMPAAGRSWCCPAWWAAVCCWRACCHDTTC
jgi:MFS family permease